jgi:hypothetical protein
MHCAVCGAPADAARSHCAICGYAHKPDAEKKWDRAIEAAVFEDLQKALQAEEALLGATRGRITGTWRRRLTLNPQAILSPFVNLGLTGERLILQPIHPATGRAFSDRTADYPLPEVLAMTVSDADVMEPGRTVRLEVHLGHGDSFRLRAGGRLADSAREMATVWQTVSGEAMTLLRPTEIACPHCHRTLDRPYRFCPFCGEKQGDA